MPFKKHISLFIALILLVSNSGLAFNVHFCEGKISSISSVFSKEEVCDMLSEKEESCCAKPDLTHKKCCSDKKVNLKNKTEKIVLKNASVDIESVVFLNDWKPIAFNATLVNSRIYKAAYYCNLHAPPLYQLYCQFTLFG